LQQNLAIKHYRNGDPILSDFSGVVGATVAYNNDESNVYNMISTTEIIQVPTQITTIIPSEYTLALTLNNYMIPLYITIQTDSEDKFFTYICKELNTRNFPVVKYFKLIKNDTNDDKDII
jgi:hypothetical protein